MTPLLRWRTMRRASHEGFNARASAKYRPIQAHAAAQAVLRIMTQPENWEHHLNQYVALQHVNHNIYNHLLSATGPLSRAS